MIGTVNVDEVEPIMFEEDIMRKLVLPRIEKDLVLSAMKPMGPGNYGSGRVYNSQGATIILLHGGPGTGKTVTTEYVAEQLQRPLISFSAAGLGATPDVVHDNLAEHLQRAERWSAVLVMEDADVILAQRSKTDIVRNAVVMTFQRALEHYRGIIVLTTTRVGILDVSIEARVQLAVGYPDLDSEGRRSIWEDLIQNGSKNLPVDKWDLKRHIPTLVQKRLNGKEILGIWRMALQMAENDHKLHWFHLESCLEVTERFVSYLNDTRGFDRAEMAHNQGERALVKLKERNEKQSGISTEDSSDDMDYKPLPSRKKKGSRS